MKIPKICILSVITAFAASLGATAALTDAVWVSLGTVDGANNPVNAIVEDKKAGVLYIGGTFSAVGSGVSLNVLALALDPAGDLYAGGQITNAGGAYIVGIAQWNGSTWSPVGSGLGYPYIFVNELVSDGMGRLYASGAFTVAGTNVSAYVVQANVLTMISKSRRSPSGGFAFNLVTTPNSINRILTATNLISPVWQAIYTNVAPANGALQYTDTATPPYPVRFYRSSSP